MKCFDSGKSKKNNRLLLLRQQITYTYFGGEQEFMLYLFENVQSTFQHINSQGRGKASKAL